MKKNDIKLIMIILFAAILCAIFFYSKKETQNAILKIEINGIEFGCYSMEKDQVIDINDTNRIEISDHKATMVWADCPDQICVQHIAISREGETIVCLPNKVNVSIIAGEQSEYDAVTN